MSATLFGYNVVKGDDDGTLNGTNRDDVIFGTRGDDFVRGMRGDDLLFGDKGADDLRGGMGFDTIRGGRGDDELRGDMQNDNLYGDGGDDVLYGDSGPKTEPGTDLGADNLDGGRGDDMLVAGDGLENLTGGAGEDTFMFKYSNPVTPLAAGTGPAFSAINDFDAKDDALAFDAAGLGDDAMGANFVDNGGGMSGGATTSFFSGAADDADGENVVVITDQAFESGALVAPTLKGEEAGDLLIYFNTTANVASLLYVSEEDTAASIARFTDINSLDDLANAGFAAENFTFA